jgi:hypothetical protein
LLCPWAIWFGPWARHSAGTATPFREDSPAAGGKIVVPRLITERIEKLRREITELSEKNRKYSLDPKYGSAVADNARRFQRLMEIIEELKSLTDWKKP